MIPDTILVKDGLQCFVFADHESDRTISESCYRTWFNGNKVDPRIVWVGYSETIESGSADDDSFLCNGKRVHFSRELFNETKKKFTMLPPSKKGRVQAVIMKVENGDIVDRETYGRTLGSDKTSVINELTNISNSIKTGYFVDKKISRKAAVIGLSILLLVSLVFFLFLTTISLMTDNKGIAAISLIREAILLTAILLIAYFLYKSIKWREFEKTDKIDFDIAMIVSFFPGIGLLYMHKWSKGLFILILFTIMISTTILSLTNDVFGPLTSTLTVTSILWIILSLYVSVMETEYECFQIGMNKDCFSAKYVEEYEGATFPLMVFFFCVMIVWLNFNIYGVLASIATSPFIVYSYRRYKSMWPKTE